MGLVDVSRSVLGEVWLRQSPGSGMNISRVSVSIRFWRGMKMTCSSYIEYVCWGGDMDRERSWLECALLGLDRDILSLGY